MGLSVVILAGGSGTRMLSNKPKVLHPIGGKALLDHVLDTVMQFQVDQVFVVYGHMGEVVKSHIVRKGLNLIWVEQKERLGTGHAVLQVLPDLNPNNQVLILYGDVPLISKETLLHLVESTGADHLGLLTAKVQDPKGLGRIVRDEYHQVSAIVEEKDASELQRQIKEINTGIYCVPAKKLAKWLPKLKNDNAQKEYYLTDIVGFARKEKMAINVSEPREIEEIYGVNSRAELARLERIYQGFMVRALMKQGVTVMDPARVDIRGNVKGASDCVVDVNVIFEGNVILGEECMIGAGSILKNVILGRNVVIHANSVIEDALIKDHVSIGPFARIRPHTVLEEESKIGNFVEIKKAHIGKRSKINHLSYIGDAEIGADVNVGAGTITCNYDGANKHLTIIEDDAFIGSDTQLVAPVRVGKGATIGAGSTITQDVPEGQLALSRPELRFVIGYKRPMKSKIEKKKSVKKSPKSSARGS
jgi:bifunctional UDP-N-acetylglucosamine pyrophosphorylase/glucosamine-1-phosphate N-acetyltransferase